MVLSPSISWNTTTNKKNISAGLLSKSQAGDDGAACASPDVNSAPSKALLAALLALQDKVRVLETERAELAAQLKAKELAAEECKALKDEIKKLRGTSNRSLKDVEQRNRLISKQAQMQLQDSVSTLTLRHQAEIESIRKIEGLCLHHFCICWRECVAAVMHLLSFNRHDTCWCTHTHTHTHMGLQHAAWNSLKMRSRN